MGNYIQLCLYIAWAIMQDIISVFQPRTILDDNWTWRIKPDMSRIVSEYGCIMNYANIVKLHKLLERV